MGLYQLFSPHGCWSLRLLRQPTIKNQHQFGSKNLWCPLSTEQQQYLNSCQHYPKSLFEELFRHEVPHLQLLNGFWWVLAYLRQLPNLHHGFLATWHQVRSLSSIEPKIGSDPRPAWPLKSDKCSFRIKSSKLAATVKCQQAWPTWTHWALRKKS